MKILKVLSAKTLYSFGKGASMQKPVRRIAITGGTHGNELTGVYLAKHFLSHPETVRRSSFETVVMLMNEKAIERCTRYIDRDLNRCFSLDNLEKGSAACYETLLARHVDRVLGPKGSSQPSVDFIVDLHSTTSNMGLSVVVNGDDPLTWQAAAHLKALHPRVNIFRWHGDTDDASFVHTVAPCGFAVEVGAVPQGVLRADLFFDTQALIATLLDYFETLNRGEAPRYDTVEIYDHVALLDYPRDENGELTAMVHPTLQDRDYTLLKKGDPLFAAFGGETIPYDREEPLHALFVNEAAYYEKGFAMCLADKRTLPLE